MSTKPFLAIMLTDPLDHGIEDVVSEIPIDLCRSRTPEYSATVTRYPVESGATITDHRRIEPDAIEIEGVVSATPINTMSVAPGQLRGDSTVAAPASAPAPTQAAHDALIDLHENGRLVTIIDQYRKYDNMALTSLQFPRTRDTGEAIEFHARFEKIRIVTTAAAALPASVLKKLKKRPKVNKDEALQRKRNQAAKQVRLGKVQPEDAKPQLATKATGTAAKVPH